MDWYKLTAETPGVLRDENGVPVEWTLLRVGDTPLCQEGADSVLTLTAERLRAIMDYFAKKGEEIPLDSEHYLYELANQKKMDEGEALRLFPAGVAALGYGALAVLALHHGAESPAESCGVGREGVPEKRPDLAQDIPAVGFQLQL